MLFRRPVPVRRRILDALIALGSLAALWLIVLAIDGRADDRLARFVSTSAATNGSALARLQESVAHVARSAIELSYVYGPLMTFTVVAAVLVLVMVRTR